MSFALGVVEPDASGPGGYGEMLVYRAGMSSPRLIEFMSRVPEEAGLGNGSDAKAPRIELLERAGDARRAESVCICLDHRQQTRRGKLGDACSVSQQRAKVDLDPGACQKALHAL